MAASSSRGVRVPITGAPGSCNLEADPHLVFHLKGAVTADLPATAHEITDEADRRAIAEWVKAHAWPNQDVEAMTSWAPMIEVTLDDKAA